MLPLPTSGFRRSVNAHNINLEICCDWVEASILFGDAEISGSDIVDILREQELYDDQDFAWEFVSDAFNTIIKRARLIGQCFPIEKHRPQALRRRDDWAAFPEYSFCLLLSIKRLYPDWVKGLGADHTEQGELFEHLTAESLAESFHGWKVHHTGWTTNNVNTLRVVVSEIAAMLGESTGELLRWTRTTANEAGLDLLCFRPFPDQRVGVPVFMVQCASGADWSTKLKTPDLRIWTKVISFASDPKKAFSLPFALSDQEFVRTCNLVDGLLLDRHRLLSPGVTRQSWVSPALGDRIRVWMTPRVAALPSYQSS